MQFLNAVTQTSTRCTHDVELDNFQVSRPLDGGQMSKVCYI
jgi:hypothetical protein